MANNQEESKITEPVRSGQPEFELPLLVRLGGALLVAASIFGVCAVVAFTWQGAKSVAGICFVLLVGSSVAGWFLGRSQGEDLVRDAGSRQRALLGINSLSSTFVILMLIVGVNYVAARRQKTFDLTRNRTNSLAPQTLDILGKLPGKVQMTYVYANSPFGPREPLPKNDVLLKNYRDNSDKISLKYLDAATDEMAYRGLQLTSFTGAAEVLIELTPDKAGDKKPSLIPDPKTRQEVSAIDEQNITSALMKLVEPKAANLYFITGHGELDATSPTMSDAKAALEAQNFKLGSISLLKGGASIPADAQGVLLVSPRVDLTDSDVKVLTSYLAGKGRLGLFLSPGLSPLPKLNAFVHSLGVDVANGAVVDQQCYQRPTNVEVPLGDVTRHPLVRGVSADLVLPACVPLTSTTPAPTGVTVTPVFQSSAQSGTVNGQQVKMGGPFTLVADVEKGSSRILLSANAIFMTNNALRVLGNQSFLLSAANWTVGNDSMLSIPPKPESNDTIAMTDSSRVFTILYSLLVLPFAVLLTGTVVWWNRR